MYVSLRHICLLIKCLLQTHDGNANRGRVVPSVLQWSELLKNGPSITPWRPQLCLTVLQSYPNLLFSPVAVLCLSSLTWLQGPFAFVLLARSLHNKVGGVRASQPGKWLVVNRSLLRNININICQSFSLVIT